MAMTLFGTRCCTATWALNALRKGAFYREFLTFRHRLSVRGSGSCKSLSIFPCQWPIPPWCSRHSGPSWQHLSTSTSASSRVLPHHLHFNNCSDVFSFISSFDVPEPFKPSPSHNHRYRFHLCFGILQGVRSINLVTTRRNKEYQE